MNNRVITETQTLRDLRHLANEIYPLLVPQGIGGGAPAAEWEAVRAQNLANRRLAAELAETAWGKLRECGPIFDGFSGYVRALADGRAEWLTCHEHGTRRYRWECNLRRPEIATDQNIWLLLQQAEACSEATYARVRALCETDLRQLRERALTRWAECERQLEAEGQLPVQLAAPSAVGGARYVCDVYVPNYLAGAFRETLAYWDAYIVRHRPNLTADGVPTHARHYTLSLASCDDQWHIGTETVMQYYADLAEAKGGVAA